VYARSRLDANRNWGSRREATTPSSGHGEIRIDDGTADDQHLVDEHMTLHRTIAVTRAVGPTRASFARLNSSPSENMRRMTPLGERLHPCPRRRRAPTCRMRGGAALDAPFECAHSRGMARTTSVRRRLAVAIAAALATLLASAPAMARGGWAGSAGGYGGARGGYAQTGRYGGGMYRGGGGGNFGGGHGYYGGQPGYYGGGRGYYGGGRGYYGGGRGYYGGGRGYYGGYRGWYGYPFAFGFPYVSFGFGYPYPYAPYPYPYSYGAYPYYGRYCGSYWGPRYCY
jgi:hypothetical protein